jgi:hypothetical protein
LEIAGKKRPNRAKLSKKDALTLKLSLKIAPLSTQVGKRAKILMVGFYQAADGSSTAHRRHGKKWQAWDGSVGSLTAAQEVEALPNSLTVSIFEGDLSGMLGSFTVFKGITKPFSLQT